MKIEKQKLAEVIKKRRAAEGYTQTELAEKTQISLRSIQRIEKGEVLPRSFTVKQLARVLGFSHKDIVSTDARDKSSQDAGKAKKIILAAGIPPVFLLLAFAFLAQSATFPETSFERSLFWAAIISILAAFQWFLWVGRKRNL